MPDRTDTERLDWLDGIEGSWRIFRLNMGWMVRVEREDPSTWEHVESIRQAIDKAMDSEAEDA